MALSAARNTLQMADVQRSPLSWPVKGSTTIYQGSLVALNAGYAAPGASASSLVAVGRAKATVVNSGSDGAVSVEVEEGTFKWANKSGDEVVAADMGSTVYISHDGEVCHTSTSKSSAGKAVKLDADGGVWVRTVLV